MAASLKIDFNNLYEIDNISHDLKVSTFNTKLNNGQALPLIVKISNQSHALLPNVYNLSFGPQNAKGKIDDKAELTHSDYSKVFSTILFSALAYLKTNPGHYLGIDGSNNARAYFYYRALKGIFLTSTNTSACLALSTLCALPALVKPSMITRLILKTSCLTLSG
ncbi:DUF6934 family protein [Paraflavitalea speifideaquila]|uniref:DUF6934 family protein n=1 Tax=Paraflavitalea speifideaquila TaxID=3076558 RepID=UPI0028E9E6EA|nr:hypothetical protein [Paraflavitalea speifideiaquila]